MKIPFSSNALVARFSPHRTHDSAELICVAILSAPLIPMRIPCNSPCSLLLLVSGYPSESENGIEPMLYSWSIHGLILLRWKSGGGTIKAPQCRRPTDPDARRVAPTVEALGVGCDPRQLGAACALAFVL